MNAFDYVVLLLALRLILPVGMILLLGEWVHSREPWRYAGR